MKRRMFSLLLTLCIIAGLLPGMTVFAADEVPASVTVNGDVTLDSTSPYYVNGASAGCADPGDGSWNAKYENGTLYLREYDGDSIRSEGDLTISLTGYNLIRSQTGPGIFCLGQLVIDGPNRGAANKRLDELLVSAWNGAGVYGHAGVAITGLSSLIVFGYDDTCLMSGPGKDISVTDVYHLFLSNRGQKPAAYSSEGNLTIQSDMLYAMSVAAPYVISTGSENVGATLTAGAELSLWNGNPEGQTVYPASSTVMVGEEQVILDGQRIIDIPESGSSYADISVVTNDTVHYVVEDGDGYYTVAYTGQTPELTFTAKDGDTVLEDFRYSTTWRNENNSILAENPTDVGRYCLSVSGRNDSYFGNADVVVVICPGEMTDPSKTAVAASVTQGNNLITLPEIPSGMQYGTPVAGGLDGSVTISSNQLAIQVNSLDDDPLTVTVPVTKISDSANCNYQDYEITVTLTRCDTPLFDLCNGSARTDVMPDKEKIDAAWTENASAAIDENIAYTAASCGYRFAGWYTAPNGWGEKVESDFAAGVTYYAHWVWTRCAVDFEGTTQIYGVLTAPKTVYTTGLDFTNENMPNTTGEGYAWDKDGKTLTLSGVQITALDSALGLVLPAGSTVRFGENSYTHYYRETAPEVDYTPSRLSTENTIYSKQLDSIPVDLYCAGDLSIENTNYQAGLGSYLITYTGGIYADGTLTMENGVYFTKRIQAKGDVTLTNVFTDVTSYVPSDEVEIMYAVTSDEGNVTVDNSAVYADNIQAGKGICVQGDRSYVYVTENIRAMTELTIRDARVKVADPWYYPENSQCGIFCDNISVTNSAVDTRKIMAINVMTITNSTLIVADSEDSPMVLAGNGSSFNNSTVEVTGVKEGGTGIMGMMQLTINGGTTTVTAAPGATMYQALLVVGYTTDPGLILNGVAVTQPATGVTVETMQFGGFVDDYKVWSVGNRCTSAAITPVFYDVPTNKEPVTPPAVDAAETFQDVEADAWYHDAVTYVLSAGLMTGMGDGQFAPDNTASRGQIASILWRLAGEPQADEGTAFADVTPDAWYTDAVTWASDMGIVSGYDTASFGPNDAVTREQLACILYRYAQSLGKGFTGSWMFPLDFTDAADVSDWAYEALCWMTMNGIMEGEDGTLNPGGTATRAETAVIFQKFAEFLK